MAEETGIEWSRSTFNPWIGCDKIAPECANCYAATLNDRRGWVEEWKSGVPRHRTAASTWKQVKKWNDEAAELPLRWRVFGDSLCDWLDEEVPIEWLADYLRLILACPNLDFLLLTKRIENFYERLGLAAEHIRKTGNDPGLEDAIMRWILGFGRAPANVHLGLTVGSRNTLEHLPFFRSVPAKVRFLSMEPLLENVVSFRFDDSPGQSLPLGAGQTDECFFDFNGVDGVIIGGESGQSGQDIRPMHPLWVDRIDVALQKYNTRTRDERLPVTLFFKQRGDWMPYNEAIRQGLKVAPDLQHIWLLFSGEQLPYVTPNRPRSDAVHMVRVGKKRAGRLFNGREYNDLPLGIIREPRND